MLDPRPHWNFEDPAASETVFRQLAARAHSASDHIVANTQVARALGLQKQFAKAHELLSELNGATDLDRAWVQLETGRVHKDEGKLVEAGKCFEQASQLAIWPISSQANEMAEHLRIDALHMYAMLLTPWEEASFLEELVQEAKATRTAAGAKWLPSLYNNIGYSWAAVGGWNDALTNFELSLNAAKLLRDSKRIFPARYAIGFALRNLGRTEEALAHMTQLQKDLLAAGRSDQFVAAELAILRGETAD